MTGHDRASRVVGEQRLRRDGDRRLSRARNSRRLQPDARIEHLPLVGTPAPDAALTTVGPRADMPSGGLVAFWNVRNIARDLGAGLIALTVRQFAFLLGRRDDVVIAVGDIFCLAACLLFARRPTVFVATAKSEYVARHSSFEAAIARRARAVFARDAATARALSERGVRATFAGNAMMDGLTATQADLPCARRTPCASASCPAAGPTLPRTPPPRRAVSRRSRRSVSAAAATCKHTCRARRPSHCVICSRA